MTAQEAYERIRAHFTDDPRYGYREATAEMEASCLYLTDDGAKCALGCLIPDGNPMQQHTGGIYSLSRSHSKELAALLGLDTDSPEEMAHTPTFKFLAEAQSEHDYCASIKHPMDVFLRRLDGIAREHRLQVVSA